MFCQAKNRMLAAQTLEAARAARDEALAAEDCEDMEREYIAERYAQVVDRIEGAAVAAARCMAIEAGIEHKRGLLAKLDAERAPTGAQRIKADELRAELAYYVASDEENPQAMRKAISDLQWARWRGRCYRLAAGKMTREDHLMRRPMVWREERQST